MQCWILHLKFLIMNNKTSRGVHLWIYVMRCIISCRVVGCCTLKKCHLFQTEVSYPEHIVNKESVAVDPEQVRAIQQRFKPLKPLDKHQLGSVLRLCTYYRRYVPMLVNIAKPSTRLIEEERCFNWEDDCQEAFNNCAYPKLPNSWKSFYSEYGCQRYKNWRCFISATKRIRKSHWTLQ